MMVSVMASYNGDWVASFYSKCSLWGIWESHVGVSCFGLQCVGSFKRKPERPSPFKVRFLKPSHPYCMLFLVIIPSGFGA